MGCGCTLDSCLPFVQARRGATGATGATGAIGNSILIINSTLAEQVLGANGSYTNLISYTLNSGSYKLTANGDSYEIIAEYARGNDSGFPGTPAARFLLNATGIGSANYNTIVFPERTEIRVRILITRISDTQVYASLEATGGNTASSGSLNGANGLCGDLITVSSLATNSFTVNLQGFKVASTTLKIKPGVIVKYLKTV
jgi:hypothetical protein